LDALWNLVLWVSAFDFYSCLDLWQSSLERIPVSNAKDQTAVDAALRSDARIYLSTFIEVYACAEMTLHRYCLRKLCGLSVEGAPDPSFGRC